MFTTLKLIIPKEELYRLYYKEKLSCRKIGKIYLIGHTAIQQRMKKARFRCRTSKEAHLGKLSWNWKGGKNSQGYPIININRLSKKKQLLFKSMAGIKNTIMIHRYNMAKHIGRPLTNEEVVHHLNGIKDDNRIVNLLLLSSGKHREFIPGLMKRIRHLEQKCAKLQGCLNDNR